MKILFRVLAVACAFSNLACSDMIPKTMQVVDSETRRPIEGARLYVKDDAYAMRSNIRGEALVPERFHEPELRVYAKNYQPLRVKLANVGRAEILMQFDSSLVNPIEKEMSFTRADTLRGAYGPYRENNDLLFYDLNIRLEVERKYLFGWNTITFKMLKNDARIQIDLFENMQVDSILFEGGKLTYARDFNAVFIDFPKTLRAGREYSIDFHYSGFPRETGRFGGIAFKEDSLGNPWIYTACQNIGASLWWPNKDQQPDEVDSMKISVEIPSELTSISNGRLLEKQDLGDGFTRYDWKVHYPINNYGVALNIGGYTHWSEKLGDLTLDYWVLPYHLERAKRQFAQTAPMVECFQDKFGPYPFPRDGYKLIEVPYAGMEHQSAVAYGNQFQNGYLARDWTGVGVSLKFDFIIIHESGHEWFGNSVTANDVSDAWIQEGWCTYAEGVYVECLFGREDAVKYFNGYKSKVKNAQPIIGPTAVNNWPTQDQYFKGALFLHTLRGVVDDDEKWWSMTRDYAAHFKYKNIFTADVINFFNDYFERDFWPIFEQYLYHPNLPILEVKFEGNSAKYRWRADVPEFDMPIKIRVPGGFRTIQPTAEWQQDPLGDMAKTDWRPAEDLFYIEVARESAGH